MIKSFFKTAYRNLIRNKVSAFINIGGLTVGMTVALLIGLWIWDELSYNHHFKNHTRIARVMQNQQFSGETTTWTNQAMQLGPELRNNYGSNFKHVVMAGFTNAHQLTYGDKHVSQQGNFMEPGITEMLSLQMTRGSRSGLNDPSSILLSESAAKAMFGDADPMNRIIKIDTRMEAKVTGLYKDLPYNSTFNDLGFIAPFSLLVKTDNLDKRVTWGNSWFQAFVQIADNAVMEKVSDNIRLAKAKVVKENEGAQMKPELFLQPMDRWHLYSEFTNGINTGGAIQYVWLLGTIGVFVLLLACINFMNLSTARSEKRAREVGVRKAVGSNRAHLVAQFFSESLLVAFLAFCFSLLLTQLTLPYFNELSEKKISIRWNQPLFWLVGISFTIITGLVAGSYPALYLSAFKPVKVLKGTFKVGRLAAIPRKALVVLQFSVSVTLIICTTTVFRQIQFAKNRPIGYDRNNLVSVGIKNDIVRNNFEAFRSEMLGTGVVSELAATDVPVTNTYVTNSGFEWPGKDPALQEQFVTMRVTHDFGKVVNWKIKEGRDFSKLFASDSAGFILNEAAVRYMGLKNALGTEVTWGGDEKFRVIGVVEDLVTQSPYDPPQPMIFVLNMQRTSNLNIKLNPHASASQAIAKIELILKKHDPGKIFDFSFADLEFARKFATEERIGSLASFFTALAVFISCLGLFGLASFVAEQRTKEIGVRKVLGASIPALWRLLTKDFVWLVIISLCVAIPLAYYFMHEWLQEFQYRVHLSWWIFASAGAGALLITILTVSFQAIKAAIANPVKSLRTE
jgi:putative ABC transport system permease protein